MADVTALDKHACPACGAQAEWHPARQTLRCPYCGTEAPYEIDADSGEVREIDLVRTLREMPESLRGWRAETRTVRCRSCRAVSVFEGARVGQNCEFCGSPELVDYDEIRSPIRPQSVLPFTIDGTRVRELVRRWFGSKWLAPSRFGSTALIDTIRGLYLPYWTFDARVECPWRADSGTYYYTTETYRDGQGRSRTRRKRHTRWRPASGVVRHVFDDEPVPGSRGVEPALLRGIEPFPTGDLVPYDTAYLSGFVIEHYQVVLIDAARTARASMDAQLERLCAAAVPGDTHRNLRIEPRYDGQTFKHVLVPVWLLRYDHHGRSYQLAVNGRTGAIAGRYPKSPWKIAAIVAAGLVALALVVGFLAL